MNQLWLIASRDGRDKSVTVHQRAEIYASVLEAGSTITYRTRSDHKIFVQLVSGELSVNGTDVAAGDGVQLRDIETIELTASSESEFCYSIWVNDLG